MFNQTAGYRRIDTMKPSHLTTPRTLGECHFQTGYKSADNPDDFAHAVLLYLAVALLLVVVPAIAFGVL